MFNRKIVEINLPAYLPVGCENSCICYYDLSNVNIIYVVSDYQIIC